MWTALLAVALLSGCGPVPGGGLGGTDAPVPSDWSATLGGERATCEGESRPDDPHSVRLECFVYKGQLFVRSHRFAFAPWWLVESWAEIWIEHPDVRVRVGDELFALTAIRITDPGQREAVLQSLGYDPVPDGMALFRLEPRG